MHCLPGLSGRLAHLQSSNILTTKKWEYVSNDDNGTESKQMDLLLVVDTSGSIGSAHILPAMPQSPDQSVCTGASPGLLSPVFL